MNEDTTMPTSMGATAESPRNLPETGAYRLETLAPQGHDADADMDGERNGVFTSLASKEGDVVGLVAYSIYKQNKHDWMLAFRRTRGRDPSAAEVAAYIVGESTPRRLSTYRYLAAATLAGQGPEIAVGKGATASSGTFTPTGKTSGSDMVARVLSVVALAAVVVIAALLVSRFGLMGH